MTNASRRTFIAQTSVAAAAAATLAIIPSLKQSRFASNPMVPQISAPTVSEPLVAYVRDASIGEISLMIGTREVIIRDVNLVARLIQAVG